MKLRRYWFTLVELIVVITILAILGTIWFVSFQGFSVSARDSKRLNDITVMERGLEYYYLSENRYPDVTWGNQVSFSGSEIWTQGTFNDDVVTNVRRVPQKPADPLTWDEYIYSLTYNKQEYQLWATFESGQSLVLLPTTYANFSWMSIKWNYNGSIIGKTLWSDFYVLAVPSLIANIDTPVEVLDVVSQRRFLQNKWRALPSWRNPISGAPETLDFNSSSPEDVILFSWTMNQALTEEWIQEIAQNIFNTYKWSPFETQEAVKSITSHANITPEVFSQVMQRTQELLSLSSTTQNLTFQVGISTGGNNIPDDSTPPDPITASFTTPNPPVPWNSGQSRIISNYITFVWTFPGFEWNTPIEFTTWWDGNPTVWLSAWGRWSSWLFEDGANIEMDVPPAWETYTSYLYTDTLTLSFTVSRQELPEINLWDFDFGTMNIWYYDGRTRVVSNWKNFSLPEPRTITVTGDWNPTAQLTSGRGSQWLVQYGTNIEVDMPERGETTVVTVELVWNIGTFTVTRAANP